MSKNHCDLQPKLGLDTFNKLQKAFGYKEAWRVYLKISTPQFRKRYKKSVVLDSEGIPTYESLMQMNAVRRFIGEDTIIKSEQKKQPIVPNTIANTDSLLKMAEAYNNDSEYYVAILDSVSGDESKLTLSILPRTEENRQIALRQKGIRSLNNKIHELLHDAGVTIENLSQVENLLGRVGVTDFNKAKELADSFAGLIRVANNKEGAFAISEEFSHLVIGCFRDDVFVQRSMNYLNNESVLRAILQDQYENVYDYYMGDTSMMAEEALGHIFRDMLHYMSIGRDVNTLPVLQRMMTAILSRFEGYDDVEYKRQIDDVFYGFSQLASDVLSGKRKITKDIVAKSYRDASFNALKEKEKVQVGALRRIAQNASKLSALLENLEERVKGEGTERSKMYNFAQDLRAIAKNAQTEQIETSVAVSAFIEKALLGLSTIYDNLKNIDTKTDSDKFDLLRNTLYELQMYEQDIKEFQAITSDEFLHDDDIAGQHFMIGDLGNTLAPYEVSEGPSQLDTEGMTMAEIADLIVEDGSYLTLSEDETHYENAEDGFKAMRTTTTIEADEDGRVFDSDSPWTLPSTNIGTGIDEPIRDFLAGKITNDNGWKVNGKNLDEVYPNASKEQLDAFADSLQAFKDRMTAQNITFITRDVKVCGTIDTEDAEGIVHKIAVAGTVDLLGYNKETGKWYLYDIKSHRGDIDEEKKKKWRRQLTLYKSFLEQRYGIEIETVAVVPVKVSYDTPAGYNDGTTEYKVQPGSAPADYSGKKNNQLLADGEPFKDASPTLEDVIPLDTIELNIDYTRLGGILNTGEEGRKILVEAMGNLHKLFSDTKLSFAQKALPAFAAFLSSYVGETIEVPIIRDGKNTGQFKTVSIASLLEDSGRGDIGWLSRWLSSMADSPMTILQVLDKVIKQKKDAHRLKTISTTQQILELAKKYERLGIVSYDFMFEEDSSQYLNKVYDKSAFTKAKRAEWQRLTRLYGKYPPAGSLAQKKKKAEYNAWIVANTLKEYTDPSTGIVYENIPNPRKYPSRYDRLSDTQKNFLSEWFEIKASLDAILGPNNTTLLNTIKIRKSNMEKLSNAVDGHMTEAIVAELEKMKNILMLDSDEASNMQVMKGKRKSTTAIRNFDGTELLKLPLYYLKTNLKPEEITHDAIGSLIAYAEMAYNYEAMDDVLNPMEVGRTVLSSMKIADTRRDIQKEEVFRYGGREFRNPIYLNTSNTRTKEMIDDFFESKIYQRYLKDQGSTEIFGKDVDHNKLASTATKIGSSLQLGFNTLAHLANATMGIAMQNIEALSGEFFSAKTLLEADTIIAEELADYVQDIGKRTTMSKLALFDEMFDVRQNFKGKAAHKDYLNKTVLTRIFGSHLQFLGQDAGDFWLYNRTAVAIALEYKTILHKDDGSTEEVSLWDALEVVPINKKIPEAGNKLVFKKGITRLNGNKFTAKDISNVSGRMRYLNQHLFGIYNDEDSISARRLIIGRFGMQYRDWIPAQFRYRFGSATTNLEKSVLGKKGDDQGSEIVEGYYRTSWRFIRQLYEDAKNGQRTLGQNWDNLTDYEKRNCKRAIIELAQFMIVGAMSSLLMGAKIKDPDKSFWHRWLAHALSTTRYSMRRLFTELAALTPTPYMVKEGKKLVDSPAAAMSVLNDTVNLMDAMWIPNWWSEDIKNGKYKGHSEGYRSFIKSPGSLWYRQVDKFLHPDEALTYYDQNN